jgi:glycosyltransferase involved in cell wall biosynthesis
VPASPAGAGEALVSVVIPTFDRRASVMRAVRSVLEQSHRRIEVVVVDDGSTDGTAEALGAVADDRLRVVSQPNGGVARARNRGLEEARGDLIAFLDSDDLWLPGKLARQVAALHGLPRRFGICVTGAEDRRGDETVAVRPAPPPGDLAVPLLIENLLHAPMATALVRREVVDAVGGFDPGFPAAEDWEWLQRVTRLFHVASVDAPLAAYVGADDGAQRSRQFRANMRARELLWQRNAHALRRHGLAHLFLMESARRELREAEGDPARGRALVLRALAERPQHRPHWPWLPYMAVPFAVRAWLRRLDAPRHARRVRAGPAG